MPIAPPTPNVAQYAARQRAADVRLTLPCPTTDLPVGLMAMAPLGDDGRLLRLGAAMEAGLAR